MDLSAAIEEIARHDGSLGWNIFVGNSSALIAPYIPFEAARTIFGDPRGLISWGPPNQHRPAAPGGYRVPANGISLRARGRPTGSAPTATSWRPTDRCG